MSKKGRIITLLLAACVLSVFSLSATAGDTCAFGKIGHTDSSCTCTVPAGQTGSCSGQYRSYDLYACIGGCECEDETCQTGSFSGAYLKVGTYSTCSGSCNQPSDCATGAPTGDLFTPIPNCFCD